MIGVEFDMEQGATLFALNARELASVTSRLFALAQRAESLASDPDSTPVDARGAILEAMARDAERLLDVARGSVAGTANAVGVMRRSAMLAQGAGRVEVGMRLKFIGRADDSGWRSVRVQGVPAEGYGWVDAVVEVCVLPSGTAMTEGVSVSRDGGTFPMPRSVARDAVCDFAVQAVCDEMGVAVEGGA